MNTQQLGTDIAADVSFHIDTGAIILVPLPYQFKGNVTRISTGVFDVTIATGEGIDLDHAEVNVYHGASLADEERAVDCLHWHVEISPASTTTNFIYRVTFELDVFVPASDATPASVTCTPTDPTYASITIRRKVPGVN
jgi:hypothetical protein